MVDTFKGHCILCLAFEGKGYKTTQNGCQQAICMPHLNKISQYMAEIPLKATAAFVWPLKVKATKQNQNGCQ